MLLPIALSLTPLTARSPWNSREKTSLTLTLFSLCETDGKNDLQMFDKQKTLAGNWLFEMTSVGLSSQRGACRLYSPQYG